jgi:hypothetical protein
VGKPRAPTPPDPRQTAAASMGTNVGTAVANTMMGNVNQVGPGGSLNYEQSGTHQWTDPFTGQSFNIPQFTARTVLTPQMQAVHDGLTGQAQRVVGNLSTAPQLDATQYRDRAESALMERMAPQFERDRTRMETQMANQGIDVGSRAFSAASDDMSRGINDARLGAILAGGDEAARMMSMDAMARSQPINEIMALLGGTQVATPQFQMNRPSPIATTDTAGLIGQNFGQRQNNYAQQMGQWNSTMGGLFGMGASFIGRPR